MTINLSFLFLFDHLSKVHNLDNSNQLLISPGPEYGRNEGSSILEEDQENETDTFTNDPTSCTDAFNSSVGGNTPWTNNAESSLTGRVQQSNSTPELRNYNGTESTTLSYNESSNNTNIIPNSFYQMSDSLNKMMSAENYFKFKLHVFFNSKDVNTNGTFLNKLTNKSSISDDLGL